MSTTHVAIIGTGNIGTDLMVKVLRSTSSLEVGLMIGIDPDSEGIARARHLGVPVVTNGIDGALGTEEFERCRIVFDATSATAHRQNAARLDGLGKQLIDLTPAAIGPFVVPPVNLDEHLGAPNVNMVTCGGQATVPIVAAVNAVTPVHYAEIVASIASRSAGPGTRANIDEFTVTTARALERVGGAERGKAIIVLNPAEPPMIMRDTVYCLTDTADAGAVVASIEDMVAEVARYVPGYRLKQPVQVCPVGEKEPLRIAEMDRKFIGLQVSVFLEVEGAAHHLPAYAGNLDIMTAAAVRTAERLVEMQVMEGS